MALSILVFACTGKIAYLGVLGPYPGEFTDTHDINVAREVTRSFARPVPLA